MSVAGVGGSAGSRWPLDRERLAELLGCAGVATHAKDAMWQTDVYVTLIAAVATAATHGSQLGQDLEILASQEFAAVELADRHSRASALMPQKRNPYALAVIRTQAGIAAGRPRGRARWPSTPARPAPTTSTCSTAASPACSTRPWRSTHLAAEVVAGMTIAPARWARAAREGFTAAADVADVLAVEAGLDYRTAHHVVGRAVRDLVDEGLTPDALTPERLSAAAEATVGQPVEISADALADALDPAACAVARPQTGSSAPEQVTAMIGECRAHIAAARELSAEARERAARARVDLRERARDLGRR